jgi:hypothetical protein
MLLLGAWSTRSVLQVAREDALHGHRVHADSSQVRSGTKFCRLYQTKTNESSRFRPQIVSISESESESDHDVVDLWPHLLWHNSQIHPWAMAMAALRASEYDIEAEMTGLDLKPRRPGGLPSLLVLRLAVTETHNWYGIGGRSGRLRRPRRLSREIRLPLASSGPDYLRSGDDCRRLIAQTTMHELRKEEGYHGLSAADWDKTVPEGVEARIAERASALPGGGGACRCDVSIRVGVEFVYSEAAELLSACADAGDLTCRRSTSSDGATSPCSICFEEMAPDDAEATCLPGCAHGFHGGCIGSWFEKASTCPVCRRDKLQFLPPDYRAVHDMMLSDPEGPC